MKPRKLPTITEIWNVTWASVVAVLAAEYLFVGPQWQRVFAAATLVGLIAFAGTLVLAFVTVWRNARKAQGDLPLGTKGDSVQGGPVQIKARQDGGQVEIRGGNSWAPDRGGEITITAGKVH